MNISSAVCFFIIFSAVIFFTKETCMFRVVSSEIFGNFPRKISGNLF